MEIVNNMPSNTKTREQMTQSFEDDNIQITSSEVKENASINPLLDFDQMADNDTYANNENQHGISSLSIDVVRDTTSAMSSSRQQSVGSTKNDECKYTGDIYGDKKHGQGVLSWPDGRMYTGAFFADRRHGFGIFSSPNISEFKGLYCHDERFGPGLLIYKSAQCADVGLWLNEHLIRLLYCHPKIKLDIHITDKRSQHSSSLVIPSWYSPQELLNTISDFDIVLKKKSRTLFCNDIQSENSFLSRYILENSDRIQIVLQDKCEQLDAYLSSIYEKNNDEIVKEKILKERIPDILPPNETYEQRRLYYYANKFWPFKQRASFPIDEIFSNNRSSFPNPGPLENSSLKLFELSFNGKEKDVRCLLMERLVYVDVCDSNGFTALHFATYNAHINIINLLLDFGANINQLSDDSLTPLALAFLLYYGNNPKDTTNTALEHTDPKIPNPRTLNVSETNTSVPSKQNVLNTSSKNQQVNFLASFESLKLDDSEKKVSYGYELTENFCERIRDENFRESVYALIVVLLRRGADPSLSDWPLPVLALAVRAGDLHMVELLLKKKTQVNCRLDAMRHSSLTPLHIACGSSSTNTIAIARLLLENGADVNAESLAGKNEYLSLIDPLAANINRKPDSQQHGRTPLHIACTREATTDTLNLVRLLLEYKANPNIVCNGQTPLSLAIAVGNQALVELLLDYENTDPATVLGFGNGNALCTILSTFYEPIWTYAQRIKLIERILEKNPKILYPIRFGPKNALGSSVDFAYFMFSADTRISQTPYHSLTSPERILYCERKDLLSYIAKRFREEASKYEDFLRLPTPTIDGYTQSPSPGYQVAQNSIPRVRSGVTDENSKLLAQFRYCATCGRSIGVRLSLCKRCQKVSFCSKACRISGWNDFHRYECVPTPNQAATKSMMPKNKEGTSIDRSLFKDGIFSIKPPAKSNNKDRLPPLTAAQLIKQRRFKKLGLSNGNLLSKLPTALDDVPLSWNSTYNAPENYSFN